MGRNTFQYDYQYHKDKYQLNMNIQLFNYISTENYDFILRILYTCLATIIINLPFGYFRGAFRKLSLLWLLAIHAPVPLVILIRKFHKLELSWELAPFLLGSYFIGQLLGKKLYKLRPIKKADKVV